MMSQNIERFLFSTISKCQLNIFIVIGKEVDFIHLSKNLLKIFVEISHLRWFTMPLKNLKIQLTNLGFEMIGNQVKPWKAGEYIKCILGSLLLKKKFNLSGTMMFREALKLE